MASSVIPQWAAPIEVATRDDAMRAGLCRDGIRDWLVENELDNETAIPADKLMANENALKVVHLSGDGSGSGYGDVAGDGYGSGYGDGSGSGDGYGSGSGYGE